ncbi:MAG: DNA repair protein RecO [Bacteroidales bacterium]|nr:DNA repair protein RecO [Bacteroidales bacterium]
MHLTTRGIVLHQTKYSDTSVIVNIFTREAGMQAFIVKGAYGKRNRGTAALLDNLSLVEITFDDNGKEIKYLREVSLYQPYALIPFDMVRRTIFIFYNELIYKILREFRADETFYDLVEEALMELDSPDAALADVHLRFMVRLARVMGIQPQANYSTSNRIFSIEESCFVHDFYPYPDFLSVEASAYLWLLLNDMPAAELPPKVVRTELLYGLIRYFEKHNSQIHSIESVEILSQLLS